MILAGAFLGQKFRDSGRCVLQGKSRQDGERISDKAILSQFIAFFFIQTSRCGSLFIYSWRFF